MRTLASALIAIDRRGQGQSLVIFAIALTAIIAMVGLIIDGGNAFVQQRATQNGNDAVAEAGAGQLARRMLGVPPTGDDSAWDARVVEAINQTAAANSVAVVGTPQYVSWNPATKVATPLGPVGTGVIPATAQGVQVGTNRTFSTYFSGVIGLTSFTATTDATAVTGYAETAAAGGLIPLTLPIHLTQCEQGGGSSRLFLPDGGVDWPVGPLNRVALPLCSNGPGNVGWIDWDPPAGGASEVGDSIRTPNSPPIRTKQWYFITEQGAITSLDDDLDTWEGKDIKLPIFHVEANPDGTPSLIGTCDDTPLNDQRDLEDCPAGDVGMNGAQGWYYLVTFADFHLEHSYIQGNHEAECNDPALVSTAGPEGAVNPPDNCLIGYFKAPVVAGEFEAGGTTPESSFSPVAIQLVE